MALSCGSATIKYLLFAFNLLFTLLSIGVIVIGVLLLVNIGNLCGSDNCDGELFPIILIVVGVASFLIAFFGCCGAIRESTCMIYTYSTFVFIVLIAHVVLAILLLVFMDDTLAWFSRELQNLWDNRNAETSFWNTIQQSFQCCGLNGPADWGSALPETCCPGNAQCTLANAFPNGCTLVGQDQLSYFGNILAYVALGAGAAQLIGFIFSCILVNSVKRAHNGYA